MNKGFFCNNRAILKQGTKFLVLLNRRILNRIYSFFITLKKRAAKGMSFLSIGSALKNSLRGNIFYVLSRKLNKLLRAFFQSSLFMS